MQRACVPQSLACSSASVPALAPFVSRFCLAAGLEVCARLPRLCFILRYIDLAFLDFRGVALKDLWEAYFEKECDGWSDWRL